MPPRFILVGETYINLDRIDSATHLEGNRWELWSRGEHVDPEAVNFQLKVVSIAPQLLDRLIVRRQRS
jgi:hypothetical protein